MLLLLDLLPEDLLDLLGVLLDELDFLAFGVFFVEDFCFVLELFELEAFGFELDFAFLVAFGFALGFFGLGSVCPNAEAVNAMASKMARRFFMEQLRMKI